MCSMERANWTLLIPTSSGRVLYFFSSFKSISVNKAGALRSLYSRLLWSSAMSRSQTLTEPLSTLSQGPPSKTNVLVSMKEHSWCTNYGHSCAKPFGTRWFTNPSSHTKPRRLSSFKCPRDKGFSAHHFKILWSVCLGPLLPNRLLLSFKCV